MEITKTKFPKINRDYLETLQINIGYKCNQACSHCHVDAGPNRKEMMSDDIIKLIPKVIKANRIKLLDITGGAPELHPKFKQLLIPIGLAPPEITVLQLSATTCLPPVNG